MFSAGAGVFLPEPEFFLPEPEPKVEKPGVCTALARCFNSISEPSSEILKNLIAVKWGELGRWCELGQNFSESSPSLLLVKGHWWAMGQNFSALCSLQLHVNAYLTTIATVTIH